MDDSFKTTDLDFAAWVFFKNKGLRISADIDEDGKKFWSLTPGVEAEYQFTQYPKVKEKITAWEARQISRVREQLQGLPVQSLLNRKSKFQLIGNKKYVKGGG